MGVTLVVNWDHTGNLFKGKTKRCLPLVDFPKDWLVTITELMRKQQKSITTCKTKKRGTEVEH